MTEESVVGRFGSGREVRRIEDAELVAGAGRFSDDVAAPSQAHLRFLRSPHAHTHIVSIDAARALAMPGVIAVLTGADLVKAGVKPLPIAPIFKRPDGSPGATPLRPALAHEAVRFIGETVAALIAETRDQANDALDAIEVEYEELPVITGVEEAVAEGARLARGVRQYRGADAPWRCGGDRGRLRQGRPCGEPRSRQSEAGADPARAAQHACEL